MVVPAKAGIHFVDFLALYFLRSEFGVLWNERAEIKPRISTIRRLCSARCVRRRVAFCLRFCRNVVTFSLKMPTKISQFQQEIGELL